MAEFLFSSNVLKVNIQSPTFIRDLLANIPFLHIFDVQVSDHWRDDADFTLIFRDVDSHSSRIDIHADRITLETCLYTIARSSSILALLEQLHSVKMLYDGCWPIHASVVATSSKRVAIVGESGDGKTSLALGPCLNAKSALVAGDQVAFSGQSGAPHISHFDDIVGLRRNMTSHLYPTQTQWLHENALQNRLTDPKLHIRLAVFQQGLDIRNLGPITDVIFIKMDPFRASSVNTSDAELACRRIFSSGSRLIQGDFYPIRSRGGLLLIPGLTFDLTVPRFNVVQNINCLIASADLRDLQGSPEFCIDWFGEFLR